VAFYGIGPGRLGTNTPGRIVWHDFGPRLGLAYQIDSKTVFRAFAGVILQDLKVAMRISRIAAVSMV